MTTEAYHPAQTINVPSDGVDHPLFRNLGVLRGYTTPVLADDGTYSLGKPTGNAEGFYLAWDVADPSNVALFSVTSASGTVTAVDIGPSWTSHTWDDADTDLKMCFYVSAGELFLKNRSGSGGVTLAIARIGSAG